MHTALVLGNGNMLVNLNERLYISDLYWPHVGQENHLTNKPNEIMVMIDGNLSSLADPQWEIEAHYIPDSLATRSFAHNKQFGIKILVKDCVLPDKNVLIRIFDIHNESDTDREVILFLKNNFFMIETDVGDTAIWYPLGQILCHYKKDRYLGVGSTSEIYQYSCTGPNDNKGKGCVPDSSGELWQNPVATGSAQSCISYKLFIPAGKRESVDSFIVAGNNFDEVTELANEIRIDKSKHLFASTEEYWKNWIDIKVNNKFSSSYPLLFDEKELNEKLFKLYKRSLLIIRTQMDNDGAIIAANDSSFVRAGGKDSYSYFWPRDGANVALSLIEVGFGDLVKKFFRYCKQVISKDGYILHKYHPDIKSGLASSWHPWVDKGGNLQLPIQEDETALIVYALWKHYEKFGDQEFLNEMWDDLIVPASKFLYEYRFGDKEASKNDAYTDIKDKDKVNRLEEEFKGSGLPRPSYDIWELDRGINTYTVSTVYAGLQAAANLALHQGHSEKVQMFSRAAEEMKEASLVHLYDEDLQRFVRGLYCDPSAQKCIQDKSIDSAFIYLWEMGMFDIKDEVFANTMKAVEDRLWVKTSIGGFARKENDHYHRVDKSIPGNPWFISTLWMARYNLKIGNKDKAIKYIKWVIDHADYTGLLAEQADPNYGIAKSVKPLTWSHAELVRTVNLIQELL